MKKDIGKTQTHSAWGSTYKYVVCTITNSDYSIDRDFIIKNFEGNPNSWIIYEKIPSYKSETKTTQTIKLSEQLTLRAAKNKVNEFFNLIEQKYETRSN